MNYSYRIKDDRIILSPTEHKNIHEGLVKGQMIHSLRNGNLIINMNFVQSVKETDEPLESEEVQNQRFMIEQPSNRQATTKGFEPIKIFNAKEYVKRNHFSYYKEKGWSHGDKCVCKEWEVRV